MNSNFMKRSEKRFDRQNQSSDTTRKNHRRRGVSTMQSRPAVLVLLLLLVLQADLARGGFEKVCNLETKNEGPNRNGLCGSNIPNTISLICTRFRRMSRGINITEEHKAKQHELKIFRMKKSAALSYLMKRQYGDQGISCECCYNHCSTAELLQYC